MQEDRSSHSRIPYPAESLLMGTTQADLVVVGAGAAGLYCALCAARDGARVVLVSATPLAESASYWAQGGLAAALAPEDSPQRHREDTLRAGRGAVRPSAADVLAREAPAVVHDLERLGVAFDADRHGTLALGLEGGHSVRRIAHAGGAATGRRITRQLSADVAEHEQRRDLGGQPRHRAARRRRAPRRRSALRRRPGGTGPRDGPGHGRRRRAVGAHDQPAGRDGQGALARLRGRRGARRPRAAAVPSDGGARRRRPTRPRGRRLPRDRGDPRRGGDAAHRRRASASSRSSPRATRWRSRSATSSPAPATRPCSSTCAASTRPGFPNVFARLSAAGLDPAATPSPSLRRRTT